MVIFSLRQALVRRWRSLMGQRGKAPDTAVQAGIDITAFLGRWYEQARYDCFFERGLDEVYADYERADGGIRITNCGTDARGRARRAVGRAVIPDASQGGCLSVSFVPPYRWFRAPFLILYADAAYTEALVAGEGGRYLWLLTRERHADEAAVRRLCDAAARRGFDLSRLRLTAHAPQFTEKRGMQGEAP